MTSLPKTLHFQVSFRSFLWLSAYFVLAMVLIWQAFLPFFAERHYRDAYVFEAQKRLFFAVDEYERAVADAPWETQYIIDLSKAYADYGMQQQDREQKLLYLNKAVEQSQLAIDYDIKNPWFKNRLATIYLSLSDVEPVNRDLYIQKAKDLTFQAQENDAKNPLFKLNMAYFYNRYGDLNKAMVFYKKAIDLDEFMPEPRLNLIEIYRQQGNIPAFLEQLTLLEQKSPGYPNVNLIIASQFIELNHKTKDNAYLQKAAFYLEKHKHIDPVNVDALRNLVAIYYQLNQKQNAIKNFEHIAQYAPALMAQYRPLYQQTLNQ